MFKGFSFRKRKEQEPIVPPTKLDVNNDSTIPGHVAIIMDGNGRWAKKRNLPRIAGHHEGMKVVRKIAREANSLGIKVLTLYAFSTENWKRPRTEVEFLMKLPQEFLGTFLPELIEENVQVRLMGNENQLPSYTVEAVKKAVEATKNNTGMILNFALNYGSRDEMIQSIKAIANDVKENKIAIESIDEALFNDYLMTSELGDPDLLIRTSGELRISNFMLWQIAYSELYFTDEFWPDFTEESLRNAILEYQNRSRRFGGV
ncbi:isoprenyl transferase [Bacillus sp. RG28]|uniref:Isoprenyl transferase n=1 Tax=Gottfriedia endophytica TaxID=2820819 RepID=A0A940NQ19_9BACI|nr:isoprenyl transferase [Gottfriedia endophytica]MBP0726209.1 isoprenyl transferase [Gottfriedia endophytica]